MSDPLTPKEAGMLWPASRFLSSLGGICLLFMVVVIAVSVFTRYVFNLPMMGVNELVQLAGVCVIMLGLPYASLQQTHVRVDIFDAALGRVGAMIGDVMARLLSGFILADLVRRAWAKMLDAYEFEDTTNMLDIPVWPFYGALAAGSALCVLVFALEIVTIFRRRAPL